MPTLETLSLFAVAALALIAIPGPNLVFVATRSITEGRRSGLASALGLLTGTAVNVVVAAAGLSAIIASSAVAFDVIRYAGAAYLVLLGIRAWRSGDHQLRIGRASGVSLVAAYRQAVLVQLLNPKVTLFFLTFLPQFVDPARGSAAGQILVLGAVLGTLGFAADCGYALAASALSRRAEGLRHRGRVTGAIYVLLGAFAASVGRPAT